MQIIAQMFISLLLLVSGHLKAEYTYQQAHNEHLESLLTLINTHAIHDDKNIVILPKKFRKQSLEQAIAEKKIYVTLNKDNEVIAYKKLYIIENASDKTNILTDELRCIGTHRQPKTASFINTNHNDTPTPFMLDDQDVYIYNGGDFTHPNYRNKGINKELTHYALEQQRKKINLQAMQRIILAYGLTKANAGKDGNTPDRTPSIAKTFSTFIMDITNQSQDPALEHHAFKAYMPTFDPDNQECKPRSDKHAIKGYGNLLIANLKDAQ